MFGEVGYYIGQAFGIVAVVTGFLSLQMKTPKGILFFQILTGFVFTVHYFLLGAMTATALNLVASAKCICYYIRDKMGSNNIYVPAFFAVLMIVTGILTWDAWYSVFITAGLFINAISFALKNPQNTRKLTLIKSPLCLTYNVFVLSTGGIIFEAAMLSSAVLGLIKNQKAAAAAQ